jgi:hypothetical protein
LLLASERGDASTVRVLVEHGASVWAVDKVNIHAHALTNTSHTIIEHSERAAGAPSASDLADAGSPQPLTPWGALQQLQAAQPAANLFAGGGSLGALAGRADAGRLAARTAA